MNAHDDSNVYLNRTKIPGAYYPLVREEVLHGEPRLQVRVLLSLHSPHRAPHPRSRRQNLHQVSLMTFQASRLSMLKTASHYSSLNSDRTFVSLVPLVQTQF